MLSLIEQNKAFNGIVQGHYPRIIAINNYDPYTESLFCAHTKMHEH